MHKNRYYIFLTLFIVFLTFNFFTLNTSANSKKNIKIVSSLNFYGEVAQKIVGKYGSTENIINSPSIDAEDYTPTIKDAKKISDAQIIIENGLKYDPWLNNLIEANDKQDSVINVGKIMNKKMSDNPHIWYDPQTLSKLVNKILLSCDELEPQHKKYFQHNAQTYLQEVNKWHNQINRLRIQHGNKRIAVSEPVMNYLLEAADFKIENKKFALSVEEGVDPSPKQMSETIALFKKHKVIAFVVNSQNSDQSVDYLTNIAKHNHIPIVYTTETLPNHMTYLEWMISQTNKLQKLYNAN